VTLVLVIVSASHIFADAGTRAAVVQLEEPMEDVVSTALLSVPLQGLAGSIVIGAAAPLVAYFYDEPELTVLTLAMAPLLFLWSLSVIPDALLQRRFELRARRGVVDPLGIGMYGVVVVVLALAGWEESGGSWYLARPRFRDGRPTAVAYRRIRTYARPLLLANVVETVAAQSKPIALGRNLSPREVGLWGAGSRLAALPVQGVTTVAAEVMFPALSRLQGDRERFSLRLLEVLRLISLLSIPIAVTLIGLGEEGVAALFGERWREAGTVLQVLAVGALFFSLADAAREAFKASGRSSLVARNSSIEVGVFLVYLAAIWVFGLVTLVSVAAGVALASLVAMVTAVSSLGVTADTSVRQLWHAVMPASVGGLVQCAVLLGLVYGPLDGLGGWTHILGVELGAVVPLVVLTGLAVLGALVYAGTAELAERGSVRDLIRTLRGILRGGRSAA
jgi:O-antigen/teichoic acid export membrane protein